MKTTIKIILFFLLVGALADHMPYGYYQFLRLAVSLGMGVLAYEEFTHNRRIIGVFCAGIVLLFNPIRKIVLDKETWQNTDFWLAAAILVWLISDLIIFFIRRRKYKREA
jgi:hypothetical protein